MSCKHCKVNPLPYQDGWYLFDCNDIVHDHYYLPLVQDTIKEEQQIAKWKSLYSRQENYAIKIVNKKIVAKRPI